MYPMGALGVGAREIGYLFGMYKKQRNEFTGVLTGKGLWGRQPHPAGSHRVRSGLFCGRDAAAREESMDGKVCLVSGSGNVAQHTAQKIIELGGKVITLSDSSGYIFDPEGIDRDKVLSSSA